MSDIKQLLSKELGGTKNIYPLAYTEGIKEKASGKSLKEILNGFNSYFVSYAQDITTTRSSVPVLVRRQGMELTYVDTNNNLISERYTGNAVDEVSWTNPHNWKVIKTNIPYFKIENSIFYYSSDGVNWTTAGYIRNTNVFVSETAPDDNTDINLWVDPSETSLLNSDSEVTKEIKERLVALEANIDSLTKLTTIGIVAGDSTNGYRMQIMATADPVKPEDAEDTDEESEETEIKPSTEGLEPTTTHISVKSDTAANINTNKQNLINSELVFYTDRHSLAVYYDGKFYLAGGSSGGGGGMSEDDLYELDIKNLTFTDGANTYKVFVNSDGKWQITEYDKDAILVGSPEATWNVYINHLLSINEVYCGEGSSNPLVSHSFVELANGSNIDINLNGMHLLYTDCTKENPDDVGYIWHVLDLQGIIKAGSTFLIRGAKHCDTSSSFIPIDTYDMEWKEDNKLLGFKQGNASFYLTVGDAYKELLENNKLGSPWSSTLSVGYIDSCGFGTNAVREGNSAFNVKSNWDNTLFVRWYMLDPCKQGNKAYASRSTTALWTYIDLSRFEEEMGNSIQYYYPDYMKQKFTPKASYEKKNFFTNKNIFDAATPNYISVTFGIQATDNGEGATRCFNWISVGNYNEYLEYRLKGTTTWNKVYSITKNNRSNTEDINKFIEHYQRLRWCTSYGTWVTSHKCIIKGLTAGEYEYQIGRDNSDSYRSPIKYFTVRANSEVTNFSFVQTTDQQGFNWVEYQAWKKAAYVISRDESNVDFTINTGDITQNGNRVNEWLDYYDGRQYLDNKEEMFTIGNNDLCGHDATKLTNGEDATSKYNHINILRYFTFELDSRNEYSFTWGDTKYPIYSLYSFNYGNYHFISLNSEIAIASSKMYKDWSSDTYAGDESMAKAANAAIEEWFKKDLALYKGTDNPTNCSNCIVYMHEMPFTIVTWSFMSSASARVGSHLNTLNDYGNYRFSRLFKQYGIRLVIGGHKHTYSISKPIYDAPANYIKSNKVDSSIDFMGDVTTNDTRVPVIQVLKETDAKISNFARYEVVNKINAPVYVMSQATGYKLVSNKEQPSGPEYTIPWLLSYFKAMNNSNNPTENVAQHYPMYIRYDLTDSNITVTAKQIHNIWDVNIHNNFKKFDFNSQLTTTTPVNMTLSTITDEDVNAYSITNKESYIINL